MCSDKNIHIAVRKLVCYGLEKNLISAEDRIYAANAVCEVMGIEDYDPPAENFTGVELEPVLRKLLDYAVGKVLPRTVLSAATCLTPK